MLWQKSENASYKADYELLQRVHLGRGEVGATCIQTVLPSLAAENTLDPYGRLLSGILGVYLDYGSHECWRGTCSVDTEKNLIAVLDAVVNKHCLNS